jgi:hypothetical protein
VTPAADIGIGCLAGDGLLPLVLAVYVVDFAQALV